MKSIIAALLVITFFMSCKRFENSELNFFNPILDISVDDLKKMDFVFLEDFNFYYKVNSDTAYWYFCRYDQEPVLERIIDIQNWQFYDSLKINNWIEDKGGRIISNLQKQKNKTKFFVRGKKSGLISKCSIIENHLQIEFYYPDLPVIQRSLYRDPTTGELSYEYEGISVGKSISNPDLNNH